MHGGLPFIGVSVLVYGAVGAAVIARAALRRRRSPRSAGGCEAGAASAANRGVRAWPVSQ